METTHHLDGTRPENLHGWFGGLEPVLRVEPGDSVVYRTPDAMWDREDPDPATGEVSRLARPVWVGGAQPGDVLVVRVRETLTRDWGKRYTDRGSAPSAASSPANQTTFGTNISFGSRSTGDAAS
ncbi:MAG TPA: hypothetical protein VKA51_06740 [Rubrobacteraceae bacterium]|nr:hypothetical protein [Rubrobacteraceae bacterium]